MSITIDPPELLFPTKVLSSFDTDFDSYKEDMIEWMRLYSLENETNSRSNLGGYQSPDNFYFEDSFAPYMNRIAEQIDCTVEEYINDESTELHPESLQVCNMWFNFNYENCYNVTHTHPGCVLAGVFWIQCDESCPIVFECVDSFSRASITKAVSETFEATPGTMMIFPAHLPHRVDINRKRTPRISMSFNLVKK